MTSRTNDNFRQNFWTWVDPAPPPFEQCSKKLHFFEMGASLILIIIFIVIIINMIKSHSWLWSSSQKWWEWSATGRGTAKASEGHKSVQLQNLSFLSGRCHPLLLPNFPKCLIHNCTIFLCSLDVGNIDDQFRCTGTEEKDHPAG